MEISDNARVFSAHDEHIGKIDRIVIDPITRELSHIVVRSGVFFPDDKVIPVADIATATAERVNLVTGVDPDQYPPFEEHNYVPLSPAAFEKAGVSQPATPLRPTMPAYVWYGQHGVLPPPHESFIATVASRNIPEHAVTIQPGSPVIAHDHEVIGEVAEVIATEDGVATHIVLKDGGLSSMDRAIPVTFVDRIVEGSVRLAVDGAVVSALPPFAQGDLHPSNETDPEEDATVQIGGYRLQTALSDVTDLTLQIQHLRWNLPQNEDALRADLDDFDALVRAGADSIARRMRELGVPPDGRVNTIYHDLTYEPLAAGPFDAATAIRTFSRRLTQLVHRLAESLAVLSEPDAESHKVLQTLSEEIHRWSEDFTAGSERV